MVGQKFAMPEYTMATSSQWRMKAIWPYVPLPGLFYGTPRPASSLSNNIHAPDTKPLPTPYMQSASRGLIMNDLCSMYMFTHKPPHVTLLAIYTAAINTLPHP